MDDFERELKVGFIEEAAQSVADVEQCFLELETNASSEENLNRIFRLAHNLKGGSRAVGFADLGVFTHAFETFILRVKNGELRPEPRVVNLLLRANDRVRELLQAYKEDLNASFDASDLIGEMESFSASAPAGPGEAVVDDAASDETAGESSQVADSPGGDEAGGYALEAPAADSWAEQEQAVAEAEVPRALAERLSAPSPAVAHDGDGPSENEVELAQVPTAAEAAGAAEATSAAVAASAAAATSAPAAASAAVAASDAKLAALDKNPASRPQQAPVDESIRVSLGKIEGLLNGIGEMVILQTVLREQVARDPSRSLKTLGELIKVGKGLQELAMSLRMVPIKPTFLKMQRIVRDTAQAVGKDVGIRLVGEDAELDKTVLERISDPLVHLVRNSVDHGIESAESRRARGKPERGMVTLVAAHHAGRFVLEVQDDGAGLDPDKLVKKAIEKKLVQPGAQLTEKEAIQLIFAPGFSTKELVTDVSGRGVGMDVVKTNIRELGGEIEIRSVKGEGTTFRIELPLTLAIVDAMVLACSKQRFVIPLSQIHETLQPKPEMAKTTAIGSILLLRGETLPMFFLGDFFNVPCKRDATQATALVIRAPQLSFALVVDEILGQQQVVVKQLNRDLNKRVSGVSGTTILGDGRPSLIIEAAELIKRNPTPRRSEERTAS